MDARNRFETSTTFLLYRFEHFALLMVSVVFAVMNYESIRWGPFFLLFWYIDVIGYLPGAIVYRLRDGKVPPFYFHLYNFTHNYATNVAVILLWCFLIGPEWALLAIPIHLFGDRSIFGNSLKPTGVSFEPKMHPAFRKFQDLYLVRVNEGPQ